jgi:hypothetical protein
METSYTCQFCGKDTSEVEYDYLSGTDHLSCALQQEQNQKNPIEKCIICGVDTQYRFRTPIDFRYNYIEGAGQLCDKCANKDEEPIALDSHRNLFTVSEYTVLSTSNDQELGAKVRQSYWNLKNKK